MYNTHNEPGWNWAVKEEKVENEKNKNKKKKKKKKENRLKICCVTDVTKLIRIICNQEVIDT